MPLAMGPAMGPTGAVEVIVPGGFADAEGWQRAAALRPVTGADEAYLADLSPGPPAAQTTALLVRCLDRLGNRLASWRSLIVTRSRPAMRCSVLDCRTP